MTLKSAPIVAAALLFAIAVTNPVNAADKGAGQDKPVATVNNIAIPQARFDLNLKAFGMQGQPDSPDLRNKIKEELIDLEVIAQEVRKKGLDKQPETIQLIEMTKQNILRNVFAQDYVKSHPISEETLKQQYENQKKNVVGKKEYKVAHILVDSEKEAQDIAALLKNKGGFAQIAKDKSKDSNSKTQGGELGWAPTAAFAQPFSEAMAKLDKGQTSAPVKTQYGWHIIKVDDVRDFTIPSFDKVKDEIEKRMQQKALQEAVKTLREKAKIN